MDFPLNIFIHSFIHSLLLGTADSTRGADVCVCVCVSVMFSLGLGLGLEPCGLVNNVISANS